MITEGSETNNMLATTELAAAHPGAFINSLMWRFKQCYYQGLPFDNKTFAMHLVPDCNLIKT